MPRTPKPRARLSRKETSARNRERLLESAGQLISGGGIGGTSLEAIANHAGLTKGAVYSQFDSKEDLLIALLDRRFEVGYDELNAVFEPGEPLASLLGKLDTWHRGTTTEGRLWATLELELALASIRQPRLRQKLRARQTGSRAQLAEMIERLADEHGLELPLPPDEFSLILSAVSDGLLVYWMNNSEEVPDGLFGRFIASVVKIDRSD